MPSSSAITYDGISPGDVGHEVALAALDDLVDDLLAQLLRSAGAAARAARGVNSLLIDPAQPRVVRRVGHQHHLVPADVDGPASSAIMIVGSDENVSESRPTAARRRSGSPPRSRARRRLGVAVHRVVLAQPARTASCGCPSANERGSSRAIVGDAGPTATASSRYRP